MPDLDASAPTRHDLLSRFANDAILLIDEDFRIVDANERAPEFYGFSREDLLGLSLRDIRIDDQPTLLADRAAELREKGSLIFESVNRRKDGSTFPSEVSVRVVEYDGHRYFHTIVRDITQRREAEERLAESVRRMRQAEYAASLGHWRMDFTTGAFEASDGLRALLGGGDGPGDVRAMTGPDAERLVHPDDVSARRDALARLAAGEAVAFTWRILLPDGRVRSLETSGEPLRDDDGALAGAFGITQDVTERLEAETAARAVGDRFAALFENMLEGFAYCRMVFDDEGRPDDFVYLDVNPAFGRLTGLEDAVGRRVTELIPSLKELNPELLTIYGDVASTGVPAEFDIDFGPLDKWLHVSATRPREGEFVAFFYDISAAKTAEAELRRSSAKLTAALESMTDAVFISDTEGTFVEFNEAFATFHRFGSKAECARTLAEYPDFLEVSFPGGEVAPLEQWAVPRALRGETAVDAEYALRRKDTGETWIGSYSFAPVCDESGAIVGSVVIGRDISERKRMEDALHESEDRFRSFFELSPVGKSLTRPGGELEANPAFCAMTGYTRDELALMRWQDLTLPEDMEEVEAAIAPLFSGDRDTTQFVRRYRRKDGSVFWGDVATAMRRDADGRPLYFITSVMDITERLAAEEQVRRLAAALEERVEQRTAELAAANDELEAFAYTVSHDLRAPLRHISAFAKLLEEELGDELGADAQHFLERILGSSAEMGVLIDDLLQFSRLGRAALDCSAVDMERCANEALESFGQEIGERGVEVRLGGLPPAWGDHALLRQVWANLLGNAVKYTRPRETAVIEVAGRLGDGEVEYTVRDNGVGFEMKYADKLFVVFQRLHASGEFEGTGIGLASVRRIVERHGGRVWAEAEPDAFAEFHFALPVGEQEVRQPRPS